MNPTGWRGEHPSGARRRRLTKVIEAARGRRDIAVVFLRVGADGADSQSRDSPRCIPLSGVLRAV